MILAEIANDSYRGLCWGQLLLDCQVEAQGYIRLVVEQVVLACTLSDLFGDIAGLANLGLLLLHVWRDNGIFQARLGL